MKAREGQINGVQRHARRAVELLQSIHTERLADNGNFCGVNLDELILGARSLADQPIVDNTPSTIGRVVIPIRLTLSDLDRVST